jgi:hypothetical protein
LSSVIRRIALLRACGHEVLVLEDAQHLARDRRAEHRVRVCEAMDEALPGAVTVSYTSPLPAANANGQ